MVCLILDGKYRSQFDLDAALSRVGDMPSPDLTGMDPTELLSRFGRLRIASRTVQKIGSKQGDDVADCDWIILTLMVGDERMIDRERRAASLKRRREKKQAKRRRKFLEKLESGNIFNADFVWFVIGVSRKSKAKC